ncbi:hypothetical protein Tco_1541286 [Tanacetum coccineum]
MDWRSGVGVDTAYPRHGYAVSSMMDTAYWLSEQYPSKYLLLSSTDSKANVAWQNECHIYDAYNEVACLMLGSITPELHRQFENYSPYEMLQELKSMFDVTSGVRKGLTIQLSCFEKTKRKDLIVGLILNGLTSDFAGFMRNYNMHNIGKTISELHAMLTEYEKGRDEKKRLDHLKQDLRMPLSKVEVEGVTVIAICEKIVVVVVVVMVGVEYLNVNQRGRDGDKILNGAFRGVGDEEVVVREGVMVTSSSLEMLTNSCLGGIMVSLIFMEGLEEEALVVFMVEWFEEDEDGKKNGKEGLFNLKA